MTARRARRWAWRLALLVWPWPAAAWAQSPPPPEPPSPEAPAAGDESAGACFDPFSEAQRLRREGKLIAARQALLVCSSERCPAAIAEKCQTWLGEVAGELPSIVVWAQDAAGRDTADVAVWVDGNKVADRLDGRPLDLDPGPHQVELEHAGERKSVALLLTTGEKNRRVGISFVRSAPSPPPPPSVPPPLPLPPNEPGYHISPLVWVGLSVAVAGGVVAGVTGGLALWRAADLKKRCPELACTETEQDDYDEGTRLAHTATAFTVVAGLGVALGIVGIVLSGQENESTQVGLGLGGVTLRGAF